MPLQATLPLTVQASPPATVGCLQGATHAVGASTGSRNKRYFSRPGYISRLEMAKRGLARRGRKQGVGGSVPASIESDLQQRPSSSPYVRFREDRARLVGLWNDGRELRLPANLHDLWLKHKWQSLELSDLDRPLLNMNEHGAATGNACDPSMPSLSAHGATRGRALPGTGIDGKCRQGPVQGGENLARGRPGQFQRGLVGGPGDVWG